MIRQTIEDMREVTLDSIKLTSVALSLSGIRGGSSDSVVEKAVLDRERYVAQLENELAEAIIAHKVICDFLCTAYNIEKRVFKLKYEEGMSYKETSFNIKHITERGVQRTDSKMVKKLIERYERETGG